MAGKIIGIEIRKQRVTAVRLVKGIAGNRVDTYAREEISPEADFSEALEIALRTVARQIPPQGAICMVSIPAETITYRNLNVPFTDEKKIRRVLPFELETTLPFPVEEILVEHQIIRSIKGKEGTELLAAATDIGRLSPIMAALTAARISPDVVPAGGFPTAAWLISRGNIPETGYIIDIRETSGMLFPISAGHLVSARRFPYRTSRGIQPLVTEIKRTQAALRNVFEDEFQPDEIIICGEGDGEFDRTLEQALSIGVRRTDLSKTFKVPVSTKPELPWSPTEFDGALAAALCRFHSIPLPNFRKGPFAPRGRLSAYKWNFAATGFLLVLTLGVALSGAAVDYYSLKKRLETTESRIHRVFQEALPDVSTIVEPYHQMRTALDTLNENEAQPVEAGRNARVIDILHDLSVLIPPTIDVELTRMLVTDKSMLLSGHTDAFKSVDDIKTGLEKSRFFHAVKISSTNTDKDRIRFQIKADF